jgi:hypothetical protein
MREGREAAKGVGVEPIIKIALAIGSRILKLTL